MKLQIGDTDLTKDFLNTENKKASYVPNLAAVVKLIALK